MWLKKYLLFWRRRASKRRVCVCVVCVIGGKHARQISAVGIK